MGMRDCIGIDCSTPVAREKADWKGSDDGDPWAYDRRRTSEREKVREKFNTLLARLAKLWPITDRCGTAIKGEGAGEQVREYVAELSWELVPHEWIERRNFKSSFKITYDGLHVPLRVFPMREPVAEIAKLVARDCPKCVEHISYWKIISQYGRPYGKAVAINFRVSRGCETMFGRAHGQRGMLVIVCREATNE